MASLYTRPRSPYFWIKATDPLTGRTKRESTGIRIADPDGKLRANRLRAEAEVRELSAPKVRHGERWQAWAHEYLSTRYAGTGSLKNALAALRDILVFLEEFDVATPRLLTYSIARRFMEWRKSAATLPAVHHNTARLRFVYLSILMSEAVRRGFADANPCKEVDARKIPAKKKLEITREDQLVIEAKLQSMPKWMHEQWLVLMRQGCRIGETAVPLDRIDANRGTITFRVKGGKLHTAPLHQDLQPLLERAHREKRQTLITPPPSAHAIWSLWFKRHGLPYSAHCTRVTVITRLLRAGHTPAKVCAFIGHSEEVNVIYRRLTAPDVRELLDDLSGASAPAKSSKRPAIPSRRNPDVPRARRARASA